MGMKTLIKIFLLTFLAFTSFADVTVNINGDRYYCSRDGRPPQDRQWRCVPRCEARTMDGSCRRYGDDFCGYDAVCTKRCEARHPDGECYRYAQDTCRTSEQ